MTAPPAPVGTVLLAAGASSRLGHPKQLLRLDGVSLVRRAAGAALALGAGPVVVVTGAGAGEVARELAGLPVQTVHNEAWAEGLGASLRVGVAALEARGPLAGVLVTLADQPRVGADALARLLAAFRAGGADAVAAEYGGRVGVPALFGPAWLPRLRGLGGDRGAAALLRAHPEGLRLLPLPEAADDVDTPEDALRLGLRYGSEG